MGFGQIRQGGNTNKDKKFARNCVGSSESH